MANKKVQSRFNAKTKTTSKKNAKAADSTDTLLKNKFCLNNKHAWLLWLCQCLNIGMIAVELSTWMLSVITLSLLWQAILLNKKQNLDKNKALASGLFSKSKLATIALGLFALLGCIAIALTARQVGLLISMLHLLCFSYALKAFEIKARGDFYQLILLGIFVLASSLIFKQDLAFSLLTIVLLIINLAVLLQYFSIEKRFVSDIKVIVILLGQSTVLAVVLFLVFPRLSPFWQMPTNKSAETGLSDSVKPGDIANLTRSTKLAFRADFDQQELPAYSTLYWRAMVLEDYDGKQWTRNKSKDKTATSLDLNEEIIYNQDTSSLSPLNYEITVAPSFQKYLFALAPAVLVNENQQSTETLNIKAKDDYTFMSKKVITQAKSYQLNSYLWLPLSLELSAESKQRNLAYPKGSNPKLEQLAITLKNDYQKPKARAQAVLNIINQQGYAYTLQPPLLSDNSLDQFFFDTKSGFCVHYASSFTFIMRAAGIPARMVTGYLGGEYNGSTDQESGVKTGHLSIYQYDAHAWSEIWVEDKGWIRIDPTGAVDPERVNSGWSNELLQQQSSLNNDLLSLYQVKNIEWLNTLRLQFDALDYQWTRWVIGFTAERQYDLLKSWFGNMASWKLALIIAVSLVVSMLILLLLLHFINRTKTKSQNVALWQILYNQALNRLAKQGIDKPISMTVNDFAKHIREQYPELAISFTRLTVSYNMLCYKDLSVEQKGKQISLMKQQYKDFKQTLNSNNKS
ncbi:DUF3488 and transglutaminase-like domain-containing protein [Colwellia sp. E2M01]|nr:DUF3488 and transglutaminase-like domain-containing protein [Colwellia sp. E2M01]